jgi:hypothetical protein
MDDFLRALGYFDQPGQTIPAYDPPVDLPCPYCEEPMNRFNIRTHGFMNTRHRRRSWFFRTHRTCDEKASEEQKNKLFESMSLTSEAANDDQQSERE